jgi:hypothetical protein
VIVLAMMLSILLDCWQSDTLCAQAGISCEWRQGHTSASPTGAACWCIAERHVGAECETRPNAGRVQRRRAAGSHVVKVSSFASGAHTKSATVVEPLVTTSLTLPNHVPMLDDFQMHVQR